MQSGPKFEEKKIKISPSPAPFGYELVLPNAVTFHTITPPGSRKNQERT